MTEPRGAKQVAGSPGRPAVSSLPQPLPRYGANWLEWDLGYCRTCGALPDPTLLIIDPRADAQGRLLPDDEGNLVGDWMHGVSLGSISEACGPVVEASRVGEWIISPDTGEILAHVGRSGGWQPQTVTDCEWVLSLIQEAESEADAIERRKLLILENLTKLAEIPRRRSVWLRERFGTAMRTVTERETAGTKRRSIRTAFGILKLGRTRGSRTIPDVKAAASFLLDHDAEQMVKFTPKVNVTDLDVWASLALEQLGLLKVDRPHDEFTVNTGF